MKSPYRIWPRLVCRALLCLLAAPAWAQPPTLTEALDAAWARSLEAAESRGQMGVAKAERQVAAAWLAGAPALELSQRQGRGAAADGARETEVGLLLPLWRPGQRQLGSQAAQVEQDWADASERAAKLRLLGQLRELSGALRAAQAELRQSEQQAQALQELSLDVARRVKAGDLAPADALAAKAEWLAARALSVQAGQALLTQRSSWQLVTGFGVEPAPESATLRQPEDEHPVLRLAALQVERARQRVALGRAQRGGSPELGFSLRQERPGQGQPTQHSVGLSLRMPFGSEPPQQTQQLAAALAEEQVAVAAAQRSRLQLAAEQALAQASLHSVAAQAAAERERAGLLRERAALLDQSFKLGETALPDLLRALSASAQAEAAAQAQEAAHLLAQARFKQSYGIFP